MCLATQISLVQPGHLTSQDRTRWLQMRSGDPSLSGPFLSFEWLGLIGQHRPANTRVIVWRENGTAVGFLPVDVVDRVAGPVGMTLTDQHGIIAAPGRHFDLADALACVGVHSARFDHLVGDQAPFRAHVSRRRQAPFVDVGHGLGDYLAERRSAGSHLDSWLRRKQRIAEREFGALRLVVRSESTADVDALMAEKSSQYRRTGVHDLFAAEWVRAALADLVRLESSELTGYLSVLYAGEWPIARCLGIRGGPIAHWWLPTYDVGAARCSPGMLLLTGLIDALAEAGASTLDLGPGDEQYKERVMSGAASLSVAAVQASGLLSAIRRAPSLFAHLPRRTAGLLSRRLR